jgi:hypothetical protein
VGRGRFTKEHRDGYRMERGTLAVSRRGLGSPLIGHMLGWAGAKTSSSLCLSFPIHKII